jgi:hypothetical protein
MFRAKWMFLETVLCEGVSRNRVRCCTDEIVVLFSL